MATDSGTSATAALHHSDEAIHAYDKKLHLWEAESHLIDEFFPAPPASMLDIGCGNGRTTVPLHRRGYSVVGLDICEPLIELAGRAEPSAVFTVGDARSLPFEDDRFDTVLFSANGIDYMMPIAERRQSLREVKRVLKPGGRFIFSSHNALGCVYRLFRPVGLTVRAFQFIADQMPPGRSTFQWYMKWRDEALGRPLFFSAPPRANVRMLKDEGWAVLAVRSQRFPDKAARALSDVHVYYVCQRG